MTNDFYRTSILPFAAVIIKRCRGYTTSQEDFEDYYIALRKLLPIHDDVYDVHVMG